MVYIVGAGPGDIELITVKGAKLLKKADMVIYAGSLVNYKILNYTKPNCKIYNSACMTLDETINIIKQNSNLNIVRLHTGDPSIFGAIREQIDKFDELKIKYEIVPGVSSFCAAASVLKKEYTLPNVSQTVILTRMEGRTKVPEQECISELSKHNSTMIIFLSIHMLDKLVNQLLEGYKKTTPISVVYKATWKDQKIINGNLENIVQKVTDEKINKTALIVVGNFLGDKYELSKLYDKEFEHGYRKSEV